MRKTGQCGFSTDEAALRTFSQGRDYFERQGIRGLHSAVEHRGVPQGTDPAKFRESFSNGIGSAKAFGFGLLVIAPLG
jgi:CRISPR system Cascade subunit CasE